MSKSDSFCTGRTIIGLVTVLTGLQTLFTGQQQGVYDENLHELRKTYYPDTLGTDKVMSNC